MAPSDASLALSIQTCHAEEWLPQMLRSRSA